MTMDYAAYLQNMLAQAAQQNAGPEGGAPAYGSDEWALQTGGPGAMIWRELARGGALHALDPNSGVFSAMSRQYLKPEKG